ncbi:MAG: N-acetylmuramoyl-L-alanine amidase [Rhodospirillales bacterium]|nr:N-acetylmuramoyl-L-alanine amidase [Rhodospirillales bacterium]MCB9965628.1 N-acetylmuramoyl-L-alanine amidase [Rhodospirillales bacterium]MCB9973051.1 N-acetylmuramoyl-L-alanine amidase [Rhodospirillales bacterium]
MTIFHKPSPNFNDRPGGQPPAYLILHYTGMKNAADALSRLCGKDSQVSAHYTIDEDGLIYHHVDVKKRAWHAGKSFWRGMNDMNAASIGIELVNPGHEYGYRPFTSAQIFTLITLCKEIMQEYPMPAQNVLAHSDVAPVRKQDPGELFPWAELAGHGIGVWPEPTEADIEKARTWTLDEYVSHVRRYGYDPECGYEYALRAFERHFAPELILGTSQNEKIAQARLACLLRLYGDRNKA